MTLVPQPSLRWRVKDFLSDIPIQQYQFLVHGGRSLDLGGPNALLHFTEEIVVAFGMYAL